MKLKHIESYLSSIRRDFPDPKVVLEQYPTSPELTASIVQMAMERYGDVGEGRTVLDLGCGTGMLMLGCAVVGSEHVIGVDCDPEALAIAQENAETLQLEEQVDLVLAKVKPSPRSGGSPSPAVPRSKGGRGKRSGRGRGGRRQQRSGGRASSSDPAVSPTVDWTDSDDGIPLQDNCVDTVIMNPPFGTKAFVGMDVQFLKVATRLARRAVYSFHKSSTREYLLRTLNERYESAQVVAELKFDIPRMYKFHKEKSMDVQVDLIRVMVTPHQEEEGETAHDLGPEGQ